MSNKAAREIKDQIQLLKSRGMLFHDEALADSTLHNISYYRLKGYWWDMQADKVQHQFNANSYFEDVDAWKILEIASFGTLSKIYKNLAHQLPEKSLIAKEFGLSLHNELSSWLEAIAYVRNIIAHHSRLWSRNMVKSPIDRITNPTNPWLSVHLVPVQRKKPFLEHYRSSGQFCRRSCGDASIFQRAEEFQKL